MGIGPKSLFKSYANTNNYPRNSLHKKYGIFKDSRLNLIALMAVDGAVSTAKEAVSHGGCKDSGDGGDKLLQPQ